MPALTGLSAPYWDSYARGTLIMGISLGTKREYLVRATLEGIVYSIRDFIETMVDDAGTGRTHKGLPVLQLIST